MTEIAHTMTTLADAMEKMKVGECIDDGKLVIKRLSKSKFRLGEVAGDWIVSGSRAAVAAKHLARSWK